MKAERLVFYRLYLFGMLFVLLVRANHTVGALVYNDKYVLGFTKNWQAQLYAEIALFVVVLVVMAVNKRISVTWGNVRFQAIGKVMLLSTFFIMAATAMLAPDVLIMWQILLPIMVLYALGLTAKQGIAVNFLFGLRRSAVPMYSVTPKSLFTVAALVLVLMYVSNYIIWLVTDFLIPPHYNASFGNMDGEWASHLSPVITWMLMLAIIAFYHKKAPNKPLPDLEVWVKTALSLTVVYLLLDKGQVYIYQLLMGYTVDIRSFLYALAFIGVVAVHVISFTRYPKPVSETTVIRVALIVFSVFLLISFLEWQQYTNWGIFNVVSLLALSASFIIFSKQIALQLTGGKGFEKLGQALKRAFEDRD